MKYNFLFLFVFFSFSAFADQLIIEPDMGRAPILNAIHQTKNDLNLVMYGFTDDTLRNAIIDQQTKGKTVKVILEQSPYKADDENIQTQQLFTANHLNWHGTVPPYKLIHQKTLLIDHRKAIVMTFNFTKSTFKNERNFGLILDNPEKVHEIDATFNADWNHVAISHSINELIWSPDNSRQQLLTLINQAKQHIRIYSQNISDYQIIGALAKAAKRGIQVDILTSATLKPSQADYLTRAGVTIYHSKLYIHAKVFIIDNSKASIGSINLTRASLDDNRELAVMTEDPAIINQLIQTFLQDSHQTNSLSTLNNASAVHRSLRLLAKTYRQYRRIISMNTKHTKRVRYREDFV